MKIEDENRREGYHIFRGKDTFAEDEQKERAHTERVYARTNIKNYCKQFEEHVLLSEFPFAAFDTEQQLRFIGKIKAEGTGTILSAATNEVNTKVGRKSPEDLLVEWDEQKVDRLLHILRDSPLLPDTEALLKEAQEFTIQCTNGFIRAVENGHLSSEYSFITILLCDCRDKLLSYPVEIQTDCLLFYIRHVEDCIRFMILYWIAQRQQRISGTPVSEYFPDFIQMSCKLQTKSTPPASSKAITQLNIEDAFHHYAIYMKYIIPFIMQGNIEKDVYPLVEKEFSTWSLELLSGFLEDRDSAIIQGFCAANLEINEDNIRDVKRFYEIFKSDRTYFHDECDPVIWALLGFICLKCDAKVMPVRITRKSADSRNSGHSKGRAVYSIKKFATELLSLKPGEKIQNDMRLFYIQQIIELGTAFFHQTYEDIFEVQDYMDRITEPLSRLLLLYDTQKSIERLSEILIQAWNSLSSENSFNKS